jgi:hypothetical protein
MSLSPVRRLVALVTGIVLMDGKKDECRNGLARSVAAVPTRRVLGLYAGSFSQRRKLLDKSTGRLLRVEVRQQGFEDFTAGMG